MPSKKQIIEYWNDKKNWPTYKAGDTRYWIETKSCAGRLAVEGAEERECFCCGKEGITEIHHIIPLAAIPEEEVIKSIVLEKMGLGTDINDFDPDWLEADERRKWKQLSSAEKRKHLESMKDYNKPSNLHLLCHLCHKKAPHTNDPELYWRWFASVPSFISQIVDAVKEGFKQVDATSYELEAMAKEGIDTSKMQEVASKLGFHHPENDILTITTSVVAKMILDFRNKHKIT